MNEDLIKSLVDLIDETIVEVEELKKSDRFSAAEIKLEGPGQGIDGKDPNGKIEKDEDEKEDDEDEKKKKEFAAKDHKHEVECEVKKEEKDEDDKDEDGKDEDEKEDKKPEEMKKSEAQADDLMKSMVEARVKPLEDKIGSILELVKSLADAPRAQKSVSYNDVAPLTKSAPESLSKSSVLEKLFDLKKSGTDVDSVDIAQAELGDANTVNRIVEKYNIK